MQNFTMSLLEYTIKHYDITVTYPSSPALASARWAVIFSSTRDISSKTKKSIVLVKEAAEVPRMTDWS